MAVRSTRGVAAARYNVWTGRELPGMQASGQLKGWGRLQEQLLDRRAQVLPGLHSADRIQITAGHTSSRLNTDSENRWARLQPVRFREPLGTPPAGSTQVEKTAGHSSSRLDSGNRWAHLQPVRHRLRKPLGTPPAG
jgi:hypothetical protein